MIEVTNFKISKSDGRTEVLAIDQEKPMSHTLLKITSSQLADALSVKQFADAAGISPQAVRKMISEDRLAAERLGNEYLIGKHELTRYLQTN